jgi:GNAT superfamily N-acetyltransferase
MSKRPATEQDMEWARTVHHAALRGVVEGQFGPWDEAQQDQFFLRDWVGGTFEIVECDGRRCGYVSVEEREADVYLREIVIAPEYQNRGIGTLVVADAIDRAGQRCVPVVLGALHANRARQLYRRLGFQEVGSTDTHTLYSRPSLRVRPAGPDDGRAAAEIYVVSSNAAFAAFQPPKELTRQQVARWETDLGRPGFHWWLADIAERPVGLAGVGPSRDPVKASVGELDTIAVVPDRWRQGIGKTLMVLANDQLDRDGFEQAVLWTWADYPAAAAFYPKVGWQPTSRRRDRGHQVCYERARAHD